LSKFINRRAVIHILFTSSKTVEYREHVIDVMESVLDHGGYIDPSATQEQVIELVQKYVERTELNSAEVEFYALRDKKYADGMTKLYDACVEELEESGELCLDEHLDNIKKRIGIYDERLDSKYILNWVDGYPEETHNPDYDEDYANDIVGRFVPDRYESYAASLPSSQRYAKQAAARAVDEAASGMKCKPKKDYWSEIEPESDGVLDLSCKEFLEWADSEASSEEEDFGKFDF
ncbi:MAG: hypothetical protein GWN31_04640, partial [Candidatus Thorarchaeota archaeon]|nr:hypothetical protein [Candidatus Thorarchaeota archaeon]